MCKKNHSDLLQDMWTTQNLNSDEKLKVFTKHIDYGKAILEKAEACENTKDLWIIFEEVISELINSSNEVQQVSNTVNELEQASIIHEEKIIKFNDLSDKLSSKVMGGNEKKFDTLDDTVEQAKETLQASFELRQKLLNISKSISSHQQKVSRETIAKYKKLKKSIIRSTYGLDITLSFFVLGFSLGKVINIIFIDWYIILIPSFFMHLLSRHFLNEKIDKFLLKRAVNRAFPIIEEAIGFNVSYDLQIFDSIKGVNEKSAFLSLESRFTDNEERLDSF
ncbi:MAG: hypothetical protein HRT55_16065 [Colwellia sp.]|uniref:hypothetical protein n=1 Tax=Alteromonadales TaxID=135622 RepID=UPI001DCC5BB2|nr:MULTISPECIES: hypothetical protein [Alteromonadales]NQZ27822.1 hypothetical protein [Colwellia sp.]NRA80325.1 hypothetical protein [Pseudoalteromonas sp.]